MRKTAVLIIAFVLLLNFPLQAKENTKEATAKIKLKDVPADHWATSAVYDLVKLGVTKGFPDGTYRGNKYINRYETAIFLSKLAKAMGTENLKADIDKLRLQIGEVKSAWMETFSFSGNYAGEWKSANLFAGKGAVRGEIGNYRLVLSATREFGENADLKIGLDTMDYGFFDDGSSQTAGRGRFASELLDIKSRVRLDLSSLKFSSPIEIELSYGPGIKPHQTDPTLLVPSEVGKVYLRPLTGVTASTNLLGAQVKGGYLSLSQATFESTGKIKTSWVTGSISLNLNRFLFFSPLKVELTGDYVSHGLFSSTDRSVKATVGLFMPLGSKVHAAGSVAVNKEASRMMIKGNVSLNDPWETGTVLTVKAAKVGSNYLSPTFNEEKYYFTDYDNFSRPLENGMVNIGGELIQSVSDKVKLTGKGDVRLTGDYKYEGATARFTAEGGISYNVAPDVDLGASYRIFHNKIANDVSDLASVGLMYRF